LPSTRPGDTAAAAPSAPSAAAAFCSWLSGGGEAAPVGPFVDTHVHLEEVLQVARRHIAIPCLNKGYDELTEEELRHWRVLGWVRDGTQEQGGEDEEEAEPKAKRVNAIWERKWWELLPEEREAAEWLGYEAEAWNRSMWLLPRSASWADLAEPMKQRLIALGEGEDTWDQWEYGDTGGGSLTFDANDLRQWDALTSKEQVAAAALGFSERLWNSEEMADLELTIRELFGPHFEGCITQGCDLDSLEPAMTLAKAHPKVFVSFGCHPKSAWAYSEKLEQRLIECARDCGSKTVAWGEFGLDYSHPHYGRLAANRRKQKDVFARQLQVAVSLGYPLVVHSRAADRDTLRMMRRWVPRDWKVHIHSFRGSVQFMELLLAEYCNAYIGLPGIVTMADPDARELCRRCPLERLVLETDAPYLPLAGYYFSHPGLIPDIIRTVADLKGRSAEDVATVIRRNARAVYGI